MVNMVDIKAVNYQAHNIVVQNYKWDAGKVFNKNLLYKSKYPNFILSRTPKKKA